MMRQEKTVSYGGRMLILAPTTAGIVGALLTIPFFGWRAASLLFVGGITVGLTAAVLLGLLGNNEEHKA